MSTFMVACVYFSLSASAAQLSVSSSTSPVIQVGQTIELPIELDAQHESVNAVQGTLHFSSDSLQIEEIRDAQSIVPFWIESPHVTSERTITFSGIVPGGFEEEQGLLFIVRAKLLRSESVSLFWSDAKVLKNDGAGTETQLATPSFAFVATTTSSVPPTIPGEVLDFVPPEPFTPVVSHDPNIFDNQWFVVFATQDKNSGVDHYEIRERRVKDQHTAWTLAHSPYVLQDQELHSSIEIRAIDRQGNIREEHLAAQYPLLSVSRSGYSSFILLGILGFGFLCSVFWWIRRKKEGRHRS